MVAQAIPRYTAREYLEMERAAESKSEFIHGFVINMAGGSANHDTISVNILSALHSKLRGGPCAPYSSNMRMGVPEANAYFYPDVSVVCGEPIYDSDFADTINNAAVVFEVLSKSTEGYDQGEKSRAWRLLPSLRHLVLVSQDRPHIELYTKTPDGTWNLRDLRSLEEMLELTAIDVQIPMKDIYERVTFGPPELPDQSPPIKS